MDILRQHVEVGQHFRFARAVVIGKDTDDFEGMPAEFEIASDGQKWKSRRELASDYHLYRAVIDPSPIDDAHLAVNLVRDRIDPAQQSAEALRVGLIGRGVESGDDL